MTKRVLGTLTLALCGLSWPVSEAAAQQEKTVFQFENRKSHRCLRLEEAPATAIVAGFLRTFTCGTAPTELIDEGRDAPARLTFDLGNGKFACVHVRAMDVKTLPSDIFANTCADQTSRWGLGGTEPDGFNDVTLFRNPSGGIDELCLSEDTTRRTVVIARCTGADEQRWKRHPVTVPIR